MTAATFDRAGDERAPMLLGSVGVVAIPVAFAITASAETLLPGTILAVKIARRSRMLAPLAVPA